MEYKYYSAKFMYAFYMHQYALCDLGAGVSVMPFSLYKKLALENLLLETCCSLHPTTSSWGDHLMHVKCIHELCTIILIFHSYLHHIRGILLLFNDYW